MGEIQVIGCHFSKRNRIKIKTAPGKLPGAVYVISELFYSATTSNGISTETSL